MAPHIKLNITVEILKSYYPVVHTLYDYICQLAESAEVRLAKVVEPSSSNPCRTLLKDSYVGLNQGRDPRLGKQLQLHEPMVSIQEVRSTVLVKYILVL